MNNNIKPHAKYARRTRACNWAWIAGATTSHSDGDIEPLFRDDARLSGNNFVAALCWTGVRQLAEQSNIVHWQDQRWRDQHKCNSQMMRGSDQQRCPFIYHQVS